MSLVLVLPTLVLGAGAASAYQTYTYSIDGEALYSPDAYSPESAITYSMMGLTSTLNDPRDLVTDKDGNVYIADTGNNRIVLLDRYYKYKGEISTFINGQGNNDKLDAPQGVFVTDDSIWICDTKNARLVEFAKKDMSFKRIVDAPESQLFDESSKYTPVAMAMNTALIHHSLATKMAQ